MKFLFSLMAGVTITAGLIIGGAFLLRQEEARRQPKEPARQSIETDAPSAKKYPYPECNACMRWLSDNEGEPDSVEVIKWWQESRAGDKIRTFARYRSKNKFGGRSVHVRSWEVHGSKISLTLSWD